MFPLSIKSKVKVFSKNYLFFEEKLSTEIYNEFATENSLDIQNNDSEQIIVGAFGRFTWKGFHLLNGVSKTKIQFEKQDFGLYVKFQLLFNEALYIALLFSIIPIFTSPELKLILKTEQYSIQILLFLIIWIVLYLGNILISLMRFHSFLKKKIKIISDEERNFILEQQIQRMKEMKEQLEKNT